jgi:hypothetical protein
MIFGNPGVTAAIGAQAFAKRQMNIQTDAILVVANIKSRLNMSGP